MAQTAGGTYYAASSELVSSWPATSLNLANQLETRFADKASLAGATYTGTHNFTGATVTGITSGALRYVAGATFTTVTSVSFPNSTFTSTYRNYKVVMQITAVASDCDLTMRLRASGSDITSANYETTMPGYTAGGTARNSFNIGATSWAIGEQDAGLVYHFMVFDLFSPQVATNTFASCTYQFVNKAGSESIMRSGDLCFLTNTQADSLTFISSAASSITGYYRVYAYTDS